METQSTTTTPARRLSLLEIVEGIQAVLDEIDAAEGEVTEETGAQLDALGLSLEQKGEGYAAIIGMLEEQASATSALAKRYTERAARKDRQAKALKQRLFDAMEATGREKIETPTATIAIQANGQASLEIIGDVPATYLKPGEPDNKKIREAIAADAAAVSFAKLVKGSHIRIR